MSGNDFWKVFGVPLALLVVFVIAFYFVFGLSKSFTKEPTLEIISGNEIVTDQSEVPITGVVKNTLTVKVGDREVPVANDGGFSVVVPVNVGENTVEVKAGKSGQVTTTIKVTRENVAKAITATSTTTNGSGSNLTTSGPVESAMGSVGLAAILVSMFIYRRSLRQNSLQKA